MILRLKDSVSDIQATSLAQAIQAILVLEPEGWVLVASAKVKEVPAAAAGLVKEAIPTATDLQLASRTYREETRSVQLHKDVVVGGNSGNTVMIAGPCSVESREQLHAAATFVDGLGIKMLRGGCYKPRTSPYTFQGLGEEGLQLLADMRKEFGMNVVTEVRDATHVDTVIEYTDVIQIGAKAMYDHGILKAAGASRKPVLLKRGFGTTLQELAQAAEFILSGGNPNVMLCERGIRTFETKTRFTLDLCGVAWLQEHTNLPVILDPSHAMGYRYGVPALTRACAAMGIDGLIIETHPDPDVALSDSAQQLTFKQFEEMYQSVEPILAAVGRKMV